MYEKTGNGEGNSKWRGRDGGGRGNEGGQGVTRRAHGDVEGGGGQGGG